MEGEKGPVCVTGGTGFIGSWLVMTLLDHGYTVRTTVRLNPAEHKKELSFLTSLPGASERLKIFSADLSKPESFRAAIEGCVGVFHVAASTDLGENEPEETVNKRSIDGAEGILKTCLDSKTVKKVIYTSSASAVVVNGKNFDEMDESFWSDADYIRALKTPGGSYMISKTLTERAVLEFSEKHKSLEVIRLVIPLVIGPFICPKVPGSIQLLLAIVLNKMFDNEGGTRNNLNIVHVDDVAKAHIFLFEHPEAKGRYNCAANAIPVEKASELVSAKFPEIPVTKQDYQEQVKGVKLLPCLSTKKLLDSGFKYKYGAEEMFVDTIKCCKEKGFV